MSEKGRGGIISPQTPHYACVRNNGVHVRCSSPRSLSATVAADMHGNCTPATSRSSCPSFQWKRSVRQASRSGHILRAMDDQLLSLERDRLLPVAWCET